MQTVVGIFAQRAEAEQAARSLEAVGIPRARITVLAPGGAGRLADVPTTEAEPPGLGKALGTVVGGAAGAAGGVQLGALVSVFVPGVGPVIALGLLGAALLGAGGAAVGDAFDKSMQEGLPKDEVFLYEDALRHGQSVVIALAEDETQAERARKTLAQAGAESLDAAREAWWIGLREAQAAHYDAEGRWFTSDEAAYRAGFEAALSGHRRGRPWGEVVEELKQRYPDLYAHEAFRRGYERGQQHDTTARRRDRAA